MGSGRFITFRHALGAAMAKDRFKKRKQNRKRKAEQDKREWSDSESEEEAAISQRKRRQNRKRKVDESKVMKPKSKKVKTVEPKTSETTMVANGDETKRKEDPEF